MQHIPIIKLVSSTFILNLTQSPAQSIKKQLFIQHIHLKYELDIQHKHVKRKTLSSTFILSENYYPAHFYLNEDYYPAHSFYMELINQHNHEKSN